jgi:anaphase-promoting complex subunit 1
MALGALFVGGGSFTFGTSDIAIASLMMAFYPLFPADVTDNKAHLQALRHLWVLAAEPRCIIVRDFDTHKPIQLPLTITLRDGFTREVKAPCLLPELESIAKVVTTSEEYWPVTLDFENNESHLEHFRRYQTLHVRQRPAHETNASPFFTSLVARNEAQSSVSTTGRMWSWIFSLPSFAEFEFEEFGLVLPNDLERNGVDVGLNSRGTVVDDRLVLRRAAEGCDPDTLWNLRLLFAWAEKTVDEEGRDRMRWIGREVVEGLRAVIEERRGIIEEVE